MGGRGSSAGSGSAIDPNVPGGANSVFAKAEPTEYTNSRSGSSGNQWKRTNLEATDVGSGEISLGSPSDVTYNQVNKNTLEATGTISHGFVNSANSSMSGSWVGMNWSNITKVSGDTYAIKSDLKDLGFKWSGTQKAWVK